MKGTRVFSIHRWPVSSGFFKTPKRTGTTPKARPVDIGSLKEAVKQHTAPVFYAALLLLGVILGALAARTADEGLLARLDILLHCDHLTRISRAPADIFAASLGSAFAFIFACFLLGLSAWGIAVIPVVPLFRGCGLGLASGFLYAAHGASGVVFNLVVILPGAFLCVLSVLFAAAEGARFSKKIAGRVFFTEKREDPLLFKNYFARFGSIMILAAASSVVDLITTLCFSGAFSF